MKRDFILSDIYSSYKKSLTKKDKETPLLFVDEDRCNSHTMLIDRKLFGDIVRDFNAEITKKIIYEAMDFNMPYRLGRLYILKYKQRIKRNEDGSVNTTSMPVDWKKTHELWEEMYGKMPMNEYKAIKGKPVVFHLNEHTDGMRCKWYWDKKHCCVKNNRAYSYLAIRDNQRELAKVLKDPDSKVDFYEKGININRKYIQWKKK